MGTMASPKLEVKRGDAPDELRPFTGHGHVEMHKMGSGHVMRGIFEPGWKWSKDVAPIAGTKSCQAAHLCYVISGRMRVRMDDGAEDEAGPGDFFKVMPGHDAWVVGSEACVVVDFGSSIEQYAKSAGTKVAPIEATATKPAQK